MSDTKHESNQGSDEAVGFTDSQSETVRRHLWLGLENTIITPVLTTWENSQLINVEKIKIAIQKFQPHFLHIFSFDIWDQSKLKSFNTSIRLSIEKELGMEINLVPTVEDDILPICGEQMKPAREVTLSDMNDFLGRASAFRRCMRKMFANTVQQGIAGEVMLIDDTVHDEIFMWTDLQVKGCILNIDKL